jgi:hypothetical protein
MVCNTTFDDPFVRCTEASIRFMTIGVGIERLDRLTCHIYEGAFRILDDSGGSTSGCPTTRILSRWWLCPQCKGATGEKGQLVKDIISNYNMDCMDSSQ